MGSKVDEAVERFGAGFNCAQAVLGTYGPGFGLSAEEAYRVATGFGGGSHIGGTCGAVTGAFMVLGLRYGNSVAAESEKKAQTYEKVAEFVKEFKRRRGGIGCAELLGCDISRPEGMKEARERGLFREVCPGLVRDAAEILEEMLGAEE